jgi:hypothetical protein
MFFSFSVIFSLFAEICSGIGFSSFELWMGRLVVVFGRRLV